ncbi:glycerol-3-phosphate acyltransferase 1, mitochondrial-like isoform X2 [Amphibalanus amphitrite]|nr:glycerol-3-phosphate acyltransferase 1, mitochondrial-like isoform X2 [Amphibalanus amphitrite]XP_043198794.1 glycerol-3-phosphate acyltransferase 1, mitochondrial-like isoform X2 [Amphibalanus amphitrite]
MIQLGGRDGGGDRPYMGGCCPRCTPHSKKAHLDPQVMQLGIRNLLRVNTMDPDRSFLVRTFCFISHTATREIRQPKADISNQAVLDTDAVQLALEQSVEMELESRGLTESPEADQLVRRVLYARAEAILTGMRTTISTVMLRFSTWALLHLLRCMLGSVLVHKGQLEAVKQAQRASPGTPVIFLPLHKSHLDYILLSFVCTNYGIQAPLVAAGDNLRIPLFGPLLSRLGAFFVKRRLDTASGRKDLLYRAILQNYMEVALARGYNMEFFIEGGRSRNGRPRPPKAGLLSVVVHAFNQQRIDDALLVPVGVSYDRIIDGNFIGEQLGRPKQGESVAAAVRAIWAVLRGRHGSVRLDLAQPFKLSEFLSTGRYPRPAPPLLDSVPLSSSPDSNSSGSSLFGLDQVDLQQRSAVSALAQHVLYDAASCCAVMSTQLVALLLLHRFRSGCTLSALTNAFGKTRDDLRTRRVDVGFTGETGDVVRSAVSLLGPGLVTEERLQMSGGPDRPPLEVTFVRPVTILPNVLELAYYSHGASQPLGVDAVLAASLLSLLTVDLAALVDAGPTRDCEVGQHQLLTAAAHLADLLSDELLLAPPCRPIEDALTEPFNRLTSAEVLVSVQDKPANESEEWASRAFARFRDQTEQADSESDYSDGDTDFGHPANETFYMVQLTADSREQLLFLQSQVAPVIDTYYITACCLHRLVGQELAEQDFVLDVLYEIKNKLMLGMLAYGESLSAETIRSALRTFRRWGVLDSFDQDGLRLIYLSRQYDGDQPLGRLVARILPFKK